jgi:hypothetical protein
MTADLPDEVGAFASTNVDVRMPRCPTFAEAAAFCLLYRGGGGCEYRARRCYRSLPGLSRI